MFPIFFLSFISQTWSFLSTCIYSPLPFKIQTFPLTYIFRVQFPHSNFPYIQPVKTSGQPFNSDTTYVGDYPDHGPRNPKDDDRLRNNVNLNRKYMNAGDTGPFMDENGGTYRDDFKNW